MKKTIIFSILILTVLPIFAKIKFSEGDINAQNEVLFTVKHEILGTTPYSTLFLVDAKNSATYLEPQILTCFPEHIELLDNAKILQVRNRYGIGYYNFENKNFKWQKTVSKIPENANRLGKYTTSPNGKYYCYVDKANYITGFLKIKDVETGRVIILDNNAQFNYKKNPVKWQPTSEILLYEKNNAIYFCNPSSLFKGIETSEEFRKIGMGSIESVNWVNDKTFAYIDSDILYKMNAKELYTLGLYSNVIGKGKIIGRLPNVFNSDLDSFSINEKITHLVVINNGRNFTLYATKGEPGDYLTVVTSRPYIDEKASFLDAEIIWATIEDDDGHREQAPCIWVQTLPYNAKKTNSAVFTFTQEKLAKIIDIEESGKAYLSPNKSRCAFFAGSTVYVYDTSTWKRIGELSGENIVSLVWQNNNTLFVGGTRTIRKWKIDEKSTQTIIVSQAINAIWSEDKIIATTGLEKNYEYNRETCTWKEIENSKLRKTESINKEFRIFCGETTNSSYTNAIYVRTLTGKPITKPIFQESTVKKNAKKQVALLFDAYDSADGLTQILYQLGEYNVKGTFFINGEFIRRYPNETKQIAATDNEIGSMFFSNTKLVSSDFIVDEDFIRKGLARNEDEFFKTTRKELSLLWHAPYYIKNEKIVQYAKNAGYTYIEPTKITGENNSIAQTLNNYMNALIKSKSGIIPISVGKNENYFYEKLDLLLSAILDAGYEIVMVRQMIN